MGEFKVGDKVVTTSKYLVLLNHGDICTVLSIDPSENLVEIRPVDPLNEVYGRCFVGFDDIEHYYKEPKVAPTSVSAPKHATEEITEVKVAVTIPKGVYLLEGQFRASDGELYNVIIEKCAE